MSNQNAQKKMSEELTDRMMGMFDQVIKTQRTHYENNPRKRPSKSEVQSIIRNTSMANAAISGGMSLIPGPFGMVAVVPEIALVINNQLKMIYDLAVAYGHENVMRKELMVGIFAGTSGMAGLGLFVIHGSKILVKRSSLRILQKIVALLGGKITQKLIKASVSKWLPGVGAIAMATWSNIQTKSIGKYACSILEKDIEISDDEIDGEKRIEESLESELESSTAETSNDILLQKFYILNNLIKVDGNIDDSEVELLTEIVEKEELDSEITGKILSNLTEKGLSKIDLSLIKNNPEEIIPLMMDLVALAKKDGTFHITEKMYIKQIGKDLGLSEDDILELFE